MFGYVYIPRDGIYVTALQDSQLFVRNHCFSTNPIFTTTHFQWNC